MRIRVRADEAAGWLQDAGVDADALRLDPRTGTLGLNHVDEDLDGAIRPGSEEQALADALDRVDGARDGFITVNARTSAAVGVLGFVADEAGGRLPAAVAVQVRAEAVARGVVFMGLTDRSVDEASALLTRAPVWSVGDPTSTRRDVVHVPGRAMLDLERSEQVTEFVATLGLDAVTAARVRAAISTSSIGIKREIAELARVWAPAERGEAIPGRLVISGHGDGEVVFENFDDTLTREDLARLAAAMPRAAAQVRHLQIAACQHGFEGRMAEYRAIFPALETIWGYAGFSPSGSAAAAHLLRWERATSAADPQEALRRARIHGMRPRAAARVWTATHGFIGLRTRPLREIDQWLRDQETHYRAVRDGIEPLGEPLTSWLAGYYTVLQEELGHVDFSQQSEAYRERWNARRDEALRLRLFETYVLPAFAQVHRATLAQGYAAIGREPPDFAHMTRRQALEAVTDFERALGEQGPAPAERLRTLMAETIRQVRVERIPVRWL